jgi:hypothetical protein
LYHNAKKPNPANTPRCKINQAIEKNFCKNLKACVTFAALVKLLEAVGHVPSLSAPTPPIYFGAYD